MEGVINKSIVTFVVTGNDTEIPPHIASAIMTIRAVGGPGQFSRVVINRTTFRRTLLFKHSAALIPGEGIFIDGTLIKKLKEDDEWFIGEIEAVRTIYTYNYHEANNEWKMKHGGESMALY